MKKVYLKVSTSSKKINNKIIWKEKVIKKLSLLKSKPKKYT